MFLMSLQNPCKHHCIGMQQPSHAYSSIHVTCTVVQAHRWHKTPTCRTLFNCLSPSSSSFLPYMNSGVLFLQHSSHLLPSPFSPNPHTFKNIISNKSRPPSLFHLLSILSSYAAHLTLTPSPCTLQPQTISFTVRQLLYACVPIIFVSIYLKLFKTWQPNSCFYTEPQQHICQMLNSPT